jgi:hypothetical protein
MAIEEFEGNYTKFAKRNNQYFLIEKDLENAFQRPDKEADIKHTAKTFGENILTTVQTLERKASFNEGKWMSRVGHFLSKLYPVATLACGLTGAIAEVYSQLAPLTSGGILHAFERSSYWSWHNFASISNCFATYYRSLKQNLAVATILFII